MMTEWEFEEIRGEIQREILRLGYTIDDFKYGIRNVIVMAVLSFDCPDNYGEYDPETGEGGYGDVFTLDGLFQYVEDCDGWQVFDWVP